MSSSPPSYTLSLKIHSGFNLPKTDLLSGIDAYCVIHVPLLGGKIEKFKTKSIDNNPNPEWKFAFFITNVDSSKDIFVEVWDKDTFSKDDLVCRAYLPSALLLKETFWDQKKFVLECLGKNKPYKAKECGIVVSAIPQVSFSELVARVKTPTKYVDENKMVLVHQLTGIFNDSLYLKVSVNKKFNISIFDTSKDPNRLTIFEVEGRNIGSRIYKYKVPRTKYGITFSKKIRLKRCDPYSLVNLKLSLGDLKLDESKIVNTLVQEHGWFGFLSFEDACAKLKNISIDKERKRIYMNEFLYSYMVDYDSKNFDQKVFLREEAAKQGHHLEFIFVDGDNFQITSYNEQPITLKCSEEKFKYTSKVNDLEYGTSFYQFKINTYKKENHKLFNLGENYLKL
ncbi:predicted protein [Naegleria gruberi]|uniref:Predicted protein n=1 Tax=Naegleria gruberi TaxID=5762 RepID=D2W487_NAEGR|nr:uncharacterized protein NAEGRDRAFT_76215 [Naegleria gruberi]EFC36114.1 predicted protein [Naegleria gruberi]|eukprot:XP_002668858.1 predicted protein [Naegleria gruberi strain NEG-M]